MHVVRTPGSARAIARTLPRPVGFVPTMGALHAGHLALVDRARRENAVVAASIFVNPLQFGKGEDFVRYPRDVARDAQLLEAAGVEVLYAPASDRMYGPDFSTSVFAGPLTAGFEGAARPGHFDGVATVIVKLVNAIEPTTLYLGQKDVQQAVVVRRMLADLDFPVDLVVAPTVREGDGLALSSRNIYLSSEERKAAPSLYRAVDAVARRIAAGEGTLEEALAAGRALLEPPLVWEYLSAVDPQRFVALEVLARPAIVVAVARAGSVRLLDNLPVAGLDGVDPIVTPPARGARVLLT